MNIRLVVIFALSFVATVSYTEQQESFMSASVFTPPGDILLQMGSAEVPFDEIVSEETQAIIDRMLEVARGERDNTGENRVMVGLAAPQIGICKRIILVDIGVDSKRKELGTLVAYINPEINWYSDEIAEGREGCYSVDGRVGGIVPRAQAIRIKAFDRQGTPVVAEFSGITARIFQHEVDHLNGIRFPDRVGPEGKLHWVEDKEYPQYRENYENWNCKCPWNLWVAMKNGDPYLPPVREEP